MNILVIGGAGYIGSRFVPALLAEGYSVTVIDLLWFGNHLPPEVPVITKDALDLEEKDFKGFDVVVFLGGLSNDPMADFNARLNFIENGAAPVLVALLAKKAGVRRYLYASTCSVYGLANKGEADETEPPHTSFPYGISKLMGETGIFQYEEPGVFDIVSLRQGTVSGYSPRLRLDLFVNTMYANAAARGEVTVRNPDIWRPIFAISDTVRAFLWAITATPGIYNVASENVTVGAVAEKVAAHFKNVHGRDVAVTTQHQFDNRNYRVSFKKTADAGFSPSENVESILKELDEKVGLAWDFGNDEYYNIKVFQRLHL